MRWLTTERVTADSWALRVTFWQCLAPYRWVRPLVRGKRVLDVGCGSGYGTAELAEEAHWVVGVDDDRSILRTVRQRYRAANLSWVVASAERLPFQDASLDVVCCFQVLEHLPAPERFLAETRRVLRPGGLLVLTTPNRAAIFSGLNPHHVREYDAGELRELVTPFFAEVEILGVVPSERVRAYRQANRKLVQRIVRLAPFGLHRRLPARIRAPLHALGTLAVRRWINARQRRLVETIGVEDFRVERGDLAQAIDLLVVARGRRGQP